MKIPRIVIPALFVLVAMLDSHAEIGILEENLQGEFNVGFTYEFLTDSSRTYDDRSRPIPLFMWYPSTEITGRPMAHSEYSNINHSPELGWGYDPERGPLVIEESIAGMIEDSICIGKLNDLVASYKDLRTIAFENTPIADGEFPLALFAPGGGTHGRLHSVLAEYLASRGFIVAAFPTISTSDSVRWPFDQTGLLMMVEDMEFCLQHLTTTIDEIADSSIALLSWSVGGVAQAMLCAKNPEIDVLVSLDSGLGRAYGVKMFEASPFSDYSQIKVPYLHLTGAAPERWNVPRSTDFYDSVGSTEKFSLIIDNFAHQHFASELGLIPELISKNGDATIIKSYYGLCNTTHLFLDAYLLGNADAKTQWLEAIEH